MLDPLNRKLLFELDLDSRQPLSQVARRLRQSRDRIEYRVDRLIEAGVINRAVVFINVYKLGFTFYKTYLRLENRGSRTEEFIAYLADHPRVHWVAFCDGSWDLAISFCATQPKDFQELHTAILSRFNDIVLNFVNYVVTDLRVYRRKYFVPGRRGFTLLGGTPEAHSLDETDAKVLNAIRKDCRISANEVAEISGVPVHVVRYRLDQLEKSEVIAGYRLDLDLAKLGMVKIKAQLFLRSYDLSLRQKFREYCDKQPHITLYIEQLGDCNLEIELEVENYQQYSQIMDEIRLTFSKLVRSYNTIFLRDVVRETIPEIVPRTAVQAG